MAACAATTPTTLVFSVWSRSWALKLPDKKVLVLGATGGAGTTASMVLGDLGAIVVPVGRTSEVNYDNIAQQSDAALLVNCTPAGMFPHCPDAPCTLEGLDALEGVIDIVYNPARTGLMLEAERRGIPCIGGLLMLAAQAAQAVERYTGKATPRERILDVTERLSHREQNIALIGMPGSGKTRVGEQIAQLTGREHFDLDRALEERLGMPCADYIVERGEAAFREQETAALADISKRSGLVLSTGGGVVTRDENYPLLHQNSQIVMLNRKLDELAHKGRPSPPAMASTSWPSSVCRATAPGPTASSTHATAPPTPRLPSSTPFHQPSSKNHHKGDRPLCGGFSFRLTARSTAKEATMKALVINGPNLNMLGIREPGIYGSDNYDRLVQICQEAGAAQGFDEVEVFQSNHEGSIVDKIQEAYWQGRRHRHQPGRLHAHERGDPRRAQSRRHPRRRGPHQRRRDPRGLPPGELRTPGLLRHHHRRGLAGLCPCVGAAERVSRKVKCQPQQTAVACSHSAPAAYKTKKPRPSSGPGLINDGAPWRIRTVDLGIRSPLLYPTELMEQITARPSKRKPVRRK